MKSCRTERGLSCLNRFGLAYNLSRYNCSTSVYAKKDEV
jgi:hypothetical protein